MLKGLLARRLRLALTSLAIGMVSGTYVLTDTINASLGRSWSGCMQVRRGRPGGSGRGTTSASSSTAAASSTTG
jgi:hypothetical protein